MKLISLQIISIGINHLLIIQKVMIDIIIIMKHLLLKILLPKLYQILKKITNNTF